MPFHSHHHQQQQQGGQPSLAAGIVQAAQLSSVGAPHGNLRTATSGITSAGTDALIPGSGNAPGLSSQSMQNIQSPVGMHSGGGQTAPPTVSGLPGPGPPSQSGSSTYETPRRATTLSRNPEELHISTAAAAMGQHGSSQPPSASAQQQHMYNSPDAYSAGGPNINLHQATPQNTQYGTPAQLQPGSGSQQQQQQQQRPGPSTAYSAPSNVPTMPQINTNAQQYTLPTRSNTMNQQQHSSLHNYSRSSPAGLGPEQKYVPFSNTPENLKFAGTPAKYYPSTPTGGASNSPLGLADIRPRANSSMAEDTSGGANYLNDTDRQPSNSNYLAPWGVYAFDWCKWNIQGGNSAGKMAIGSYLEDTHNFVRCLGVAISLSFKLTGSQIQVLDTQIVPQDGSPSGAPQFGLEYTRIAEATWSVIWGTSDSSV